VSHWGWRRPGRGLSGMPSVDALNARDAMCEPNRARMFFSVSDNLLVEGVIRDDSATTMVCGDCGGRIAE
jgi:hypothetical protein